ncbi:hypothetical protein IOLA_248 [uncultured bacterium]|nr:hypothetical protein IOLA_248 [uncultured bacterium]
MYINHDYNQLNKIIQYKLDNYKLKNDPNFNDKDIVIYSYSEIMSKKFYSWHLHYLYSNNSNIVVFKQNDKQNDKRYDLNILILPNKNKYKFAKFLFSDLGIQNSGLINLD